MTTTIYAGDIGKKVKTIELDPLPEKAPLEEPLAVPVPAEPEQVPA